MNRREFFQKTLLTGAQFSVAGIFVSLASCKRTRTQDSQLKTFIFAQDAQTPLGKLPEGFRYTILSQANDLMNDEQKLPGLPDGMGCFLATKRDSRLRSGNACLLVRNHETSLSNDSTPLVEFAYDPRCVGGTTTLELDEKLGIIRQHYSLIGTFRNCSGGKTPWHTWISCEEVSVVPEGTKGAKETYSKVSRRHGYNFEVNPRSKKMEKPIPLRAMGRFKHEAVSFDLAGIAYQSQDEGKSSFYRFIPNEKRQLQKGGKLQALVMNEEKNFHTSQHELTIGEALPCSWTDIPEADPPNDTVFTQAQEGGAAIFHRGEGMWADGNDIYLVITNGGKAGLGQIFRYRPREHLAQGTLELVYESKSRTMHAPDNMTVAPWGDLILCEDNGSDYNRLLGFTQSGHLYTIASTHLGEWAGACFSPDGKVLFANLQNNGYTLAITGPWDQLRKQS